MEVLQTLEVHRVASSADILQPGDYCFIAKRDPIRRFEPVAVELPKGFWKRIVWVMQGRPSTAMKEVLELVWPEYDAIIMNCPHCNQPIGTTKDHKILSVEPLTIEKPLGCAYSRAGFSKAPTIAFQVKDGKIMPA
jgi:hypothetical protein